MIAPVRRIAPVRHLAVMGGAYGNVSALEAAVRDARTCGADTLAFAGDALGCCGHSDETLALVRDHFDVLVAGNLEQQAAVGESTCGCGYDDAEDERLSCRAFEHALGSLGEANRRWIGTWPATATVETEAGRVLLCHGSPDRTNEFLYASGLDDARLAAWLDAAGAIALVCTHTGLPWVRRLRDGRFAVNCGTVGKPDHDGDPGVHYTFLTFRPGGGFDSGVRVEIRRVAYDHAGWAERLRREGVEEVFVTPLETGIWTTGVASLPEAERGGPWRRLAG